MKLTTWLSGAALLLGCLVVANTIQKTPNVRAQEQGQGGQVNEDSSDWLRSTIGLRIAPVTLTIGNRNPSLVGLGSYLVNVTSSCADCHSNPTYAPGHNPYLGQPKQLNVDGYLAGGHPFSGENGETVVPPNITPDGTGKPRGLSYRKFVLAMRYGQDPDDAKRLLQVMPWPSYQNLTDRDLKAIYEYLSSIPSVSAH